MTTETLFPTKNDTADAPSDWERALLDHQLERLDRLADMGLAIAGAIERRVMAAEADPPPDTTLHHAAMDFARVSRAVRMTLALQSRLIQDFKAPSRPASVSAGADTYFVRWLGEDAAQKSKVQRAVRRIAEDCGLDTERIERLTVEAGERLERDDIHDLLNRPIDEIVAQICRDLGLTRLPREAAGGGPSAERSEEPMVEGAGHGRYPSPSPLRNSS